MKTYQGAVLIVSHDRYFINQVATRVLELRPTQMVNYLGNYDFYMEHRRLEQEEQAQAAPTVNKVSFEKQKMAASEIRKREARKRKLEQTIEKNEQEIEEIKQKMLLPKYYSSASSFKELENRVAELEEQNLELMEEWDSLDSEK